MTNCKLCNTNIPDGTEYCDECLEKSKIDEVMSSDVPYDDINDFGNFDIGEDLEDEIIIDDDELFGGDLNDLINQVPMTSDNDDIEEFANQFSNELDSEAVFSESTTDDEHNVLLDNDMNASNFDDISDEKPYENTAILDEQEEQSVPKQEPLQSDDFEELENEDNIDISLDDLLNELETGETNHKDEINDMEEQYPFMEGLEPASLDSIEEEEADSDEFLSLLGQISEDDPVADDVKVINDLLHTADTKSKEMNLPGDVGEVFSDALKVVSSLKDGVTDEIDILQAADKKINKKKKVKKTKEDKNSTKKTDKVKKAGFFAKLFGKNKDKKELDANGTASNALEQDESTATKEVTGKTPTKKASKNVKKKEKIPNKKVNKKNDSASSNNQEANVNKDKADKRQKKLEEKKAKKEKKEKKEKKPKKEKKVKPEKKKEAIQVLDEIGEDEGKINSAGALTIFLFFGIIAMFILIGTNLFSYSISIKNANTYFDRKKYTQAYNEVYGIEIKDKDIETYDKIMTVMFVNKQLNSYNNYYTIKQYPEALDSLLKGLKRYDKYCELAKMLGIKGDLDYVRNQILSELREVFNLSEKDAMKIINSETQKEYSLCVYDVVIEKMKN